MKTIDDLSHKNATCYNLNNAITNLIKTGNGGSGCVSFRQRKTVQWILLQSQMSETYAFKMINKNKHTSITEHASKVTPKNTLFVLSSLQREMAYCY